MTLRSLSMDDSIEKLYSALNRGPAFLFLGQDYLRLESGHDAFLAETIRKYGPRNVIAPSYYDIFDGEAKGSKLDSLAWMQGRCERISVPNWLKIVSDFAWNGVYTSAIDVIWPKAFRKDWRELQPVLNEILNPIDPRNRSNLHCTYLFGLVDRDDESERTPLDKREWLKRKQVAAVFARRLPELITPLGLLFIEGYNSERDWFSLEDLLSTIVDELNPNQVHLFSYNREIEDDPYASLLIDEEKLVLHNEPLAQFLLRGEELGYLQLGQPLVDKGRGRRIQLKNFSLVVPTPLWNQVSRSATILDDSYISEPKPLSPDARYHEFRNFLAESGTIPVWSGYPREFAFVRDFEEKLYNEVNKKLKQKTLHDEPILLSGQTGTGKTVALGHLAYKIRKAINFPVLFIEGRSRRPLNSDIDAFCRWVKDEWEVVNKSGSPTILTIWDANDIELYYPLLRYLSGRGHRVVLVGSTYKQKSRKISKATFVEIGAPAQLKNGKDKGEIGRFTTFLNSFEPGLGQQLRQYTSMSDQSFLVTLYRLLPATRSLIRAGIIREYDRTEKDLTKIAREAGKETEDELEIFNSVLHYAMIKSGLVGEDKVLSTNKKIELGGDELTEAQQLMGLILMPGSLGLRIPFELLLRSMQKSSIRFFTDLLSQFDIFYWYQDDIGAITIGPRHTLEARLWVRSEIGGAKYEVDYAKKLLFNIRDTGNHYDNPDVQFAVDLVRSMGPNNIEGSRRYDPYLKDIADRLHSLREERNIQNPRLMLQEATFLREYVKQQSQLGTPLHNAEQVLDDAENILHAAIEIIGNEPKSRSIFLGELASILGTKFLNAVKYGSNLQAIIDLYEKARDAAFRAWSADTENYIPIDILSWTTIDLLKAPNIPETYILEAKANILHAFEMAEAEDFGALDEESLQRRRLQIGSTIGRTELSEDAFEKLKSMGSSIGYYLKAHDIISDVPFNEELTSSQRVQVEQAAKYLEENRGSINNDRRTLYLLLRVWWMSKTGKPMFYRERQTVPFTYDDWSYCYRLVQTLLTIDEIMYNNPRLIYLHGIATFHLSEIKDSFEIFKQLERQADYRTGPRRIIRSYIASLPDGKPRKFTGEVSWLSEDVTKGGVFIPEIREVVLFFPREFNRPDIRRGQSLGEFHLAFNFLGPSADPVGHLRTSKRRK